MLDKRPKVNWRHFAVIVLILVVWGYIIDTERFLYIPDFYIAYPLGIPLIVIYLWVYDKYIRDFLNRVESKNKKE
ncbi:MAG: hypothetical protein ACTSYS_07885 [Promethearchaeota archaeon]